MLARNDFLDFAFIGPGRCEARWLEAVLREHAGIVLPTPGRWPFGRRIADNRAAFLAADLQRYRARFAGAPETAILGEVDPDLIVDPMSAARLGKAFPQLRLIAFLRDPIDVALEAWHHQGSRPMPNASPVEELLATPQTIERALFHRHLLPFLDWFHPDQICVIIHERFFASEAANFARLLRFIGADEDFFPSIGLTGAIDVDPTGDPRAVAPRHPWLRRPAGDGDFEPLDDAARQRILDELEGDMRRLERLLGIDLDIWRVKQPADRDASNVIPLPAGAERRQWLAARRGTGGQSLG